MLKKLKADEVDEAEAVKKYGKRAQQLPQHSDTFKKMQSEEAGHKRNLAAIMDGLKKARPK